MDEIANPFPGLRPYSEREVPIFTRSHAVDRLHRAIRQHGLSILIGASGSGKTSLIRASLLPTLASDKNLSIQAIVAGSTAHITDALAQAIAGSAKTRRDSALGSCFVAAPTATSLFAFLTQAGYEAQSTLLVLDDYEYTLRNDDNERQRVESLLIQARKEFGLRLLFVLRSDYLPDLLAHGPLADAGTLSIVAIAGLSADEARLMITRPVQQAGAEIEPELVDTILEDLGPQIEPYALQMTMFELWRERSGQVLTVSDYRRMGGAGPLRDSTLRAQPARANWALSQSARRTGLDELSNTLAARSEELRSTQSELDRINRELAEVEAKKKRYSDRLSELTQAPDLLGPKVFVSYARADEIQVRELCERLRSEGLRPWLDKEALLIGENWQDSIRRAMRDSDFVLLCLSTHSVSKRGFVQAELKQAVEIHREFPEGQIFLLPLRLDDCDVPSTLRHLHYADLRPAGGYERLIRSILTQWSLRTEGFGKDD